MESERIMAVLAAIFATAFGVGLSGAVMPGPVLAVTIKGVARSGFWFGPLVIVGHAILELPVVLGLGLGLGDFLEQQLVLTLISIVGGTVLGFMSLSMLREARTAELPVSGSASSRVSGRKRKAVWLGIATSLSNPYWFLWWATAGLTLIAWANNLAAEQALPEGLGLSSFYVGHILSDFGWYAFISFMLATGRRLFTNRTYRTLIALCGVFLVWLSVFFLYSGIASFFSRGPIVKQLEKSTAARSFPHKDLPAGLVAKLWMGQHLGMEHDLENGDTAAFLEKGDVRLGCQRPIYLVSVTDDDSQEVDSETLSVLHSEDGVIERPQTRPCHEDPG